jgi:signal transduction histidine kinase
VEKSLPQVYGDRPRLFEVLQNLIDNAAKFMGDQPNPAIEIGTAGRTKNGTPVFFIRDNGMGIDPRYKDRIFGLFDKLDARTDGTGIGLALAKRIIELHRGRIWVESEPGKGATFFFSLPQAENLPENTV